MEFDLPTAAPVQLRVLSSSGQEVARLYQGTTSAGWHRLRWQRGGLRAGVYYVQLVSGSTTQVMQALLL